MRQRDAEHSLSQKPWGQECTLGCGGFPGWRAGTLGPENEDTGMVMKVAQGTVAPDEGAADGQRCPVHSGCEGRSGDSHKPYVEGGCVQVF